MTWDPLEAYSYTGGEGVRKVGKFSCCVLGQGTNGIASTFEWLD